MASSDSKVELPLEIWRNVFRYSSVATRIQLGRTCRAFHHSSQQKLYHTLIFDGRKPRNYYVGKNAGRTSYEPTNVDGTYVRNLELFVSMHNRQGSWLSHVKAAYLLWTVDTPGYANSIRRRKITYGFMHQHAETRMPSLSAIEDLLCHAPHKIELHMVLPLDVLPDALSRSRAHLKSLSIGCRTQIHTDYRALRDVMETPTLQTLEVFQLQTKLACVHDAIRSISSTGFSNATELHLPVCEPPTLAMSNFFNWPRHLRTLKIWICVALHNPSMLDTEFSVQEVLASISGLSSTLEDLELVFGHPSHYSRLETSPTTAFRQFSRLRRLVTSADVVASKTRSMSSMDNHTFYTNFPPSLEDLTLVFEANTMYNRALRDNMHRIIYGKPENLVKVISELHCGCADSDDGRASESDCANDLFKELAQLAEHKAELPNLRHLHLMPNFIQWLECERVKRHRNTLKESGMAVSRSYRSHLLSSFGHEFRWELLSSQ
ncbi:hypothetical protein KCU65_g4690, partial [Aureobasidium melanogenum]